MDRWMDRLNQVEEDLALMGDWNDRYVLLVEWGDELEALPEAERTAETEVFGCSSPLWLRARRTPEGLSVSGYSTGVLPRALVALLVRVFDQTKADPLDPSALMDRLMLRRHLSPTRALVMETMLRRIAEAAA